MYPAPRSTKSFFALGQSMTSLLCMLLAISGVWAVQHVFTLPTLGGFLPEQLVVPEGDPAGRPNLATRLEITSPENATLFCAREGEKHRSGYAHFTNAVGDEDKHMFWTLFEARNAPENAPVILYFGGGPGTSGLAVPFSGIGHCQVTPGPDGKGTAVPSEYPWTEFAHILAVEYPVGTGFSYGDQSSLRNSSARAAWDLDDMLQAFWRVNLDLARNQFAVGSGSYGGTYIPHLVKVIRDRNMHALTTGNVTRILKMPETVMMSNPWSDIVTRMRYAHMVSCEDMGFFNASLCHNIALATPACLDSIQFALEQPSALNRVEAMTGCWSGVTPWEKNRSGWNPYDRRQKCDTRDIMSCFPHFGWTIQTMNDTRIKDAFGLPRELQFKFMAEKEVKIPFESNGDLTQRSYKLLGPAIDEGLRVLVYNGVDDAFCPSRATEAWLRLLSSKHQAAFRTAPEINWPGVGSFYSVGEGGAGELAFVKIENAGHFVIGQQPKIARHLAEKWLKNENLE